VPATGRFVEPAPPSKRLDVIARGGYINGRSSGQGEIPDRRQSPRVPHGVSLGADPVKLRSRQSKSGWKKICENQFAILEAPKVSLSGFLVLHTDSRIRRRPVNQAPVFDKMNRMDRI
jgi:hypothetical protein